MAEKQEEMRILALAPKDMQGELERQLSPLGVKLACISRVTEFSQLLRDMKAFHVALLPATLPDSGWWSLWGEIALLNRRPEILVYAHTANFQLWSGVLEAGGYDVIVAPFTDEEIQGAVLRAAKSYEQRCLNETE